METIKIIKIGGAVIDQPVMLDAFLQKFAALTGPKVLVHGGGRMATALTEKLGEQAVTIDGRRVTSDLGLEVVTMVYAGLINTQLVAKLHGFGCPSIGLSGADGGLILARKRAPASIDYGWVGDLEAVKTSVLRSCLEQGLVPVICSITHDGRGQLLNTNADTVAAAIATALAKESNVSLRYCFEKGGVLADPNKEDSVIAILDRADFNRLKEAGIINQGMLPKLQNCFLALEEGVKEVSITSANNCFDDEKGTRIRL